jgi:hypothetical protein
VVREEGGQMRTGCKWGCLKVRDRLEEEGGGRGVTPEWIFKKMDGTAYTGSIWLRIRTLGVLL